MSLDTRVRAIERRRPKEVVNEAMADRLLRAGYDQWAWELRSGPPPRSQWERWHELGDGFVQEMVAYAKRPADADEEMRKRAIAAARQARGDPDDADGLVVVISRFARGSRDMPTDG